MRWVVSSFILFLHLHSTSQLNIPLLLQNETNIGAPGVRARISRKGINYVAVVLTENLIPDIMNAQLPDGSDEFKIGEEKIVLSEITISSSGKFGPTESDISPPNLVLLHIPNLNLTMTAALNGNLLPVPTTLSIMSESTTVRLSVEILKTSVGSPNMRIHECKAESTTGVQLDFTEGADEQQLSQLEPAIQAQGAKMLADLVCNRIQFIVEDRVNDRFGLLSTKVPLAHINDDELVKDLAAKLRARRQRREAAPEQSEDMEMEDELADMARLKRAAPWDLGAGMHLPMGMQIGAGMGRRKREALIAGFNVSLADGLSLDYTIVTDPKVTKFGLEIESSGEVSLRGRGGTPFGPVDVQLPQRVDEQFMLQDLVSDYMVNSLMYHGHTLGIFNTKVTHTTPHFGPIMRTSCSLNSGVFFCLGDLFPTLRRLHPQRRLALFFNTVQAPVIRFRTQASGGINFSLFGRIAILVVDPETRKEQQVGEMGIEVSASMKMRLTTSMVRPKITLEKIKLSTLSPTVLLQNELDDAVLLAREVLQRMVNDILKDGIPIPVKVMDRALLLQTNFELNEKLMRQLTAGDLRQRL
ncbi:hypothetical protein M3Y99_01995100 [Aphelenchoides fujianensis]|nr:hypothetical protein M3Y99_01995100 [Aphelenchoides fujianensis]